MLEICSDTDKLLLVFKTVYHFLLCNVIQRSTDMDCNTAAKKTSKFKDVIK